MATSNRFNPEKITKSDLKYLNPNLQSIYMNQVLS